jgi:hypothetical protein
MTDQELHDIIIADSTAKSLADQGKDKDCVEYLSTILPKTLVSTYINERGVFATFPNQADAEQIIQALEMVADGQPDAVPPVLPNPIVARALVWMQPNNGGIDLSYPAVRNMLDQMAQLGAITTDQVNTLKALAEKPTKVPVDDVSRVWYQYRPNGRIATS